MSPERPQDEIKGNNRTPEGDPKTVRISPGKEEDSSQSLPRISDRRAKPTAVSQDLPVGAVVGNKYEIESCLGRGGMSVVFRARDIVLDRYVAIKVMPSKTKLSQRVLQRFLQEAQAASKLEHPNLVRVYEFGIPEDGQPFLVMDYLEGHALSDIIRMEKPLEMRRVLRLAAQACSALRHAHMKNVVHRDLKPTNIMIIRGDDGEELVKIVDFGIAKLMESDAPGKKRITREGEIFGSPLYMSPEQCMGQKLDARSDIYSMGCVMYEMLVGEPPFTGADYADTVNMHLNEKPARISTLRPGTNALDRLEAIVFKALAKRPEDRYQSAGDMYLALSEIHQHLTGESLQRVEAQEVEKPDRRKKQKSEPKKNGPKKNGLVLWAVSLVVLIGLIGWGIKTTWNLSKTPEQPVADKPKPQSDLLETLGKTWMSAQMRFDMGNYSEAQDEFLEVQKSSLNLQPDDKDDYAKASLSALVDLNYVRADLDNDAGSKANLATYQKQLNDLTGQNEDMKTADIIARLDAELARQTSKSDEEVLELILQAQSTALNRDNADEAQEILTRTRKIAGRFTDFSTPGISDIFVQQARYFSSHADMNKALSLLKEALVKFDKPGVNRFNCLNALAQLEYLSHDEDHANQDLKEATTLQSEPVTDIPAVSLTIGKARLSWWNKDYVEAQRLVNTATADLENQIPPDDELLIDALEVRAQVDCMSMLTWLAKNHPDKEEDAANENPRDKLPDSVNEQHDRAVSLFKRAIAMRERVMPYDRQSIMRDYLWYADVLKPYKEFEKLVPVYQKSIELSKTVDGADSDMTIALIHNLAYTYATLSQNEQAEEFYKKALSMLKKKNGAEGVSPKNALTNDTLKETLDDYGEFLKKLGRKEIESLKNAKD